MSTKTTEPSLWQIRKDAGLCGDCGLRPPLTPEISRCRECLDKSNDYHRQRSGSKAWKKGSRGRPPSGVKHTPLIDQVAAFVAEHGSCTMEDVIQQFQSTYTRKSIETSLSRLHTSGRAERRITYHANTPPEGDDS